MKRLHSERKPSLPYQSIPLTKAARPARQYPGSADRIIEINGPRSDMIHVQYDQPRYFPLLKKVFDSIEIDVTDDAGDHIPFDSEKLIVILHFKCTKVKDSHFLG